MRLIDRTYDPATGFTDEYYYHEPTTPGGKGKLTIRRLQDVEGVLDLNKEECNMHSPNANYKDSDGLHKIARIPFAILEKWLREDGFDWFNSSDKDRRRQLMKPENRFLLVRPGKL